MSTELKWYEFSQNNSGGDFEVTTELCHRLFIEARNDVEALAKGLEMGVYLNGVRGGIDCGCCGDRWYEPNKVELPLKYSESLTFNEIKPYAQYLADKYGWTTPDARIYYADGKVVEVFSQTVRQ